MDSITDREHSTPTPASGSITALIADDEAHVRTYLRLVLRALGISMVWEANDGREAVEMYAQHRPTIVLLDVNMPLLSGEDVIRELAGRFPEAAVIVVTSQSEHQTVKRFVEMGAIGYVLKQQPREVVINMIAEAIDLLEVEGAA